MRLCGLVVLVGIPDSSTFHLIQSSRLSGGSPLGGVLFMHSLYTCVGWGFLGIGCMCCRYFVRVGCHACKSRHD